MTTTSIDLNSPLPEAPPPPPPEAPPPPPPIEVKNSNPQSNASKVFSEQLLDDVKKTLKKTPPPPDKRTVTPIKQSQAPNPLNQPRQTNAMQKYLTGTVSRHLSTIFGQMTNSSQLPDNIPKKSSKEDVKKEPEWKKRVISVNTVDPEMASSSELKKSDDSSINEQKTPFPVKQTRIHPQRAKTPVQQDLDNSLAKSMFERRSQINPNTMARQTKNPVVQSNLTLQSDILNSDQKLKENEEKPVAQSNSPPQSISPRDANNESEKGVVVSDSEKEKLESNKSGSQTRYNLITYSSHNATSSEASQKQEKTSKRRSSTASANGQSLKKKELAEIQSMTLEEAQRAIEQDKEKTELIKHLEIQIKALKDKRRIERLTLRNAFGLPLVSLSINGVISALINIESAFKNINFKLMIWRPLVSSNVTLSCDSLNSCGVILEKGLKNGFPSILQTASWFTISAALNFSSQYLPLISKLSPTKRRVISDFVGAAVLISSLQHYSIDYKIAEIATLTLGTYAVEFGLRHVIAPIINTIF